MRKAEEVLRAFIPILNTRDGQEYFSLFSSWSTILGDDMADIAAHSEPVDVKNGALIIFVDHPGWMQKLDFRKRQIIYRLKKHYPQLGIDNIFIQKVSNENFLERREARLLGDNPRLQPRPNTDGPESPGQDPQIRQNEGESERRQEIPKPPEDSHLAETFRRLEELSRKAKR